MSDKHITDKFVSVDRYYISGLHPHIWKHPEGEMVYFDDYVNLWVEKERLKAEVERLRASSFVTAVPSEEYDKLKAEVERLRKAGDAMVEHIRLGEELCFETLDGDKVVQAWNAAKEGRPNE